MGGKRKRAEELILHPNVDRKTPGAEAVSALLHAAYGDEAVAGALYSVHDTYVSITIPPKMLETAKKFRDISDVASTIGVCVDMHITTNVELHVSAEPAPRLFAPGRPIKKVCPEICNEATRIYTAIVHSLIAQNKPVARAEKPVDVADCGIGTARIRIARDTAENASDIIGITRICGYLVDPDNVDMWWDIEAATIDLYVRSRRTIEK